MAKPLTREELDAMCAEIRRIEGDRPNWAWTAHVAIERRKARNRRKAARRARRR